MHAALSKELVLLDATLHRRVKDIEVVRRLQTIPAGARDACIASIWGATADDHLEPEAVAREVEGDQVAFDLGSLWRFSPLRSLRVDWPVLLPVRQHVPGRFGALEHGFTKRGCARRRVVELVGACEGAAANVARSAAGPISLFVVLRLA